MATWECLQPRQASAPVTFRIAAACDVSLTILASIRSGIRTQIRKRTQDRILGVTRLALSDATLVPSTETWHQIDMLLEEGFTKAELARRLGFERPALQIGKDRILARTAARVDRLFRMLMKE
jgi:hypothetical protein